MTEPEKEKIRPRECSTRTFADLADTRGFREPGDLRVYGLELTKDGFYKRAPVTARPDFLEPEWAVNLAILPQQIYIEHKPSEIVDDDKTEHEGIYKLLRLSNSGTMLVDYVTNVRDTLDVTGQLGFYAISTKMPTVANLKAIATFAADRNILKNPPKGSTIYLELILHEAPPGWVEVFPGLSIKWTLPQVAGLILTNPAGKLITTSTSPDIKFKGDKASVVFIHASIYYDIVRLLFTTLHVDDKYLEHLSGDVARREAILKARAKSS
jgi:hypothetical protein